MERSTEQQQNTHYSQVHMEYSPGQTKMLGYKVSLNEFKGIKILQSVLVNDWNKIRNQ